jgi:hypothetical protein
VPKVAPLPGTAWHSSRICIVCSIYPLVHLGLWPFRDY